MHLHSNIGQQFQPDDMQGSQIYVAIPQQAQPAPRTDGQQFQLSSLIAAFRRRWLSTILIGAFLGGCAGAAVWKLVPETYSSSAEFIIQPNQQIVYDFRKTGEVPVDLQMYKETLKREATFPHVLQATLRDEHVRNCETVRGEDDPEKWLKENIKISSPASEFLEVALTGSNPDDVFHIVDAFTKAFQAEVLDRDRLMERSTLEKQKGILRTEEDKLTQKRNQLRTMDQQIAANTEQANMKFEKHKDRLIQFEQLIGQIDIMILEAQFRLNVLKGEIARKAAEEKEEVIAGIDATAAEEAEPIAKINIPDEVVERQLLADPEYQKLYTELTRVENEVEIWQQKVRDEHPTLLKKREDAQVALGRLEDFKKMAFPLMREKLEEAITVELKKAESKMRQAEIQTIAGQGGLQPQETEESIQTQIRNLEARRELYSKQVGELDAEGRELTVQWVNREILAEEVAELKENVRFLSDRVNAREVEIQNTAEPVSIRRPAVKPRTADVGNRIKLTAMSSIGIFGFIGTLLIWREYVRQRISTGDQVNDNLGLVLLGTVPLIPRTITNQSGKTKGTKSAFWHSALAESFNSARAMLTRNADVGNMRCIMVASAMGGEGKTTLSCHLATSLAKSGRKTLLIDADLRRPSVSRVFNVDNNAGFCDVIRGKKSIDEVIVEVQPGLTILPAGNFCQEVLNALTQEPMKNVMDEVKQRFDIIIVDSSPVIPISDGLLISQHCDGVLFSVRKDVSQLRKVSAAVNKFRMLGVPILGAVAIGLDSEGGYGSRYPYFYSYGYQGSHYGQQ